MATSYRTLATDAHDQLHAGLARGAMNPPTTYSVGLFNQYTDDLHEGDGLGAITTEPSTGNYQRQSMPASELTASRADGALRLTGPEITFNVTGSEQDVDSWFATTGFDYNDDSNIESRLIVFGALSPGGDRVVPGDGYYTVPLERPDRYILTDVSWSFDTSHAGSV